MFARKYRLTKKKDFERLYKKGRSVKKDFLIFKTLKNDLENSRIGIVISKKAMKKAVKRNLMKRRIREAIRQILPEIKENIDIVIIVKQEKGFQEIQQVIKQALL